MSAPILVPIQLYLYVSVCVKHCVCLSVCLLGVCLWRSACMFLFLSVKDRCSHRTQRRVGRGWRHRRPTDCARNDLQGTESRSVATRASWRRLALPQLVDCVWCERGSRTTRVCRPRAAAWARASCNLGTCTIEQTDPWRLDPKHMCCSKGASGESSQVFVLLERDRSVTNDQDDVWSWRSGTQCWSARFKDF